MTPDSPLHEPRILVVRLSSLGDIVHTLPALARLRRGLPDARIDWVVEDRFAETLELSPEIATVHALSRRDGSIARWRAMRTLAQHGYELAIDFQGLLKSALVARVAGVPVRVGFARGHSRELAWALYNRQVAPPRNARNIVERNLALATAAIRVLGGTVDENTELASQSADRMRIPEAASVRVEERLSSRGIECRRFAVLNPGARWATKRWPVDRYVALARRMQTELGLDIAVTAFGDERELGAAIVDGLGGAASLLDDLTILEHAAVCARAAVVVGSDTGPVHLAHFAGTPVVWLFGPTDAWRNAPPGTHGIALQSSLECVGCWKRTCPLYDSPRCMEALDVETVFDAVRAQLAT